MKLQFSQQILKKVTHEEKKVGYSMLYASVTDSILNRTVCPRRQIMPFTVYAAPGLAVCGSCSGR